MGQFVKVASKKDLAPGRCVVAEAGSKEIALFNVDGEFFATDNACLHAGGPLGEGELDGAVVTCPWHGWRFNVKTGESAMNPAAKVAVFPVKIEGNDILVEV